MEANWDQFGSNPDEWSEWLRFDPGEAVSPDSSTKTSNNSPMQDINFNADHFPPLNVDETLAPPLIVGDDANFGDFSFADAAFDFGQPDAKTDDLPFLFGADSNSLQPIVDHLNTDPKEPSASSSSLWPPIGQNIDAPAQSDLLAPIILASNDYPASGPASVSSTSQHRSSPASTSHARTSISSISPAPEQADQPVKKKGGRKRKVSQSDEEQQSPEDGGPPIKKTSHNVIEKRYRNNLNDKIAELRDSVPSLRAMSRPSGNDDSEDLEGLTPAHKLNKATVLAKATEYIKHLEKRAKTQADELTQLKARMSNMEKAMSRSAAANQHAGILTPAIARSRQGSITSQAPRRIQQDQYLQQHSQPTYEPQEHVAEPGQNNLVNAQGAGNGFVGKLMVGSLAALMVMEGFHEQEQDAHSTSGRGLFAAPMHLLKRGQFLRSPSHAAYGSSAQAALPLLKTFLVFGAFIYILLPLFRFKPQPKRKLSIRVSLTAAPSLASPVEVRRKAWLTAVQSVWMPRHFLLEVVSVTCKMIMLSLRRLVGSEFYSRVSGKTPDDEAARIKAWDIAIDAQLAGGDAEVSYYRLLLTLMASGTLPDSPIRLMQKAVHFRIFFWEVANAGYGNMFMFRDFTAKVGRIYWDSARKQQHAIAAGEYTEKQITDDKIERLPEYLAELIELDCDDVLTDEMIQRAYNLAWNRPSAEKAIPNQTMDSVVEDHAIRSPLDAVAAWFANMTVDAALTRALDTDTNATADVQYLVDLANKTAPPASATQTRAHVAKAVVLDQNRGAHIIAALETLPMATYNDGLDMPSNMITHTPISPDTHSALTLAKVLSIASPTNPTPARAHAASVLSSMHLMPNRITLLTAVAAFKVLSAFSSDALLFNSGKLGLDDLAGNLRVWIGTRAAKTAGLTREQKATIVESCLGVSKRVGGWKEEEEKDSGYGSLEDVEREGAVVKA
ncbi:hypothetical protein D6D02_08762 [Aureobasidium pullulans]|nr:hypothetical protein D6D02_08762 [Aureobasidium pullulans]